MTTFLTALGNEVRKGLRFAWSERLQIVLELAFFALIIVLLGPMLGAGRRIAAGHMSWTLNAGRISLLVIAFVPAMFFYFQAVKLFWRLLAEIQSGTIEQVYLSPLPSWLVAAAGRLAAAVIETLGVMGVVYGIISGFVTVRFHWTPAALVPAAFLIVTGTGYSLIIGGMTLVWKRIQLLREADPGIAQLVKMLRGRPEARWSVDVMARSAGMSRTSFTTRFRAAIGDPPWPTSPSCGSGARPVICPRQPRAPARSPI